MSLRCRSPGPSLHPGSKTLSGGVVALRLACQQFSCSFFAYTCFSVGVLFSLPPCLPASVCWCVVLSPSLPLSPSLFVRVSCFPAELEFSWLDLQNGSGCLPEQHTHNQIRRQACRQETHSIFFSEQLLVRAVLSGAETLDALQLAELRT